MATPRSLEERVQRARNAYAAFACQDETALQEIFSTARGWGDAGNPARFGIDRATIDTTTRRHKHDEIAFFVG